MEGLENEKCWYILWPFGIFSGHLEYLVVIWYLYFQVLVFCTKTNLANPDT
jgi:hypothetical protein